MTDKRTKADLLRELEEAKNRPPAVAIETIQIGDMGTIHLDAIVALADAAKANAKAIAAIAGKASVFIETGILINTGKAS